ncbi:hypothetical protein QN360_11450, partial [Glaciimonas sp. CA11.2]|uniref:hypothetical protein n=1 Tax=Glaciimonas sp. CA11.2 TaxID=3048601 RepID=UPI002B23B55C
SNDALPFLKLKTVLVFSLVHHCVLFDPCAREVEKKAVRVHSLSTSRCSRLQAITAMMPYLS